MIPTSDTQIQTANPLPSTIAPQKPNPTATQPQYYHLMHTRAKTKITKTVQKYSLATSADKPKPKIPTSVAEVLRDPQWRKAMRDEINAVI